MRNVFFLSPALLLALVVWAQNSPDAQKGAMKHDMKNMKNMSKEDMSKKGMPMDMSQMKMGVLGQNTYEMDMALNPRAVVPGQKTELTFTINDPKGQQATKFQIMHAKLFHMFIVSEDLEYFVHDHPVFGDDARFRYTEAFPRPGMFRILGDFYPEGADPQLVAKTVYAAGPSQTPAKLSRDYAPKDGENMRVEFSTVPEQPIAGDTTQLHFDISPAEGIEKYLDTWGHMLVASDDVIDLIHTHPFIADGGPHVQFNVTFPRARTYRVWVQFQREGKVSTLRYDVPVKTL